MDKTDGHLGAEKSRRGHQNPAVPAMTTLLGQTPTWTGSGTFCRAGVGRCFFEANSRIIGHYCHSEPQGACYWRLPHLAWTRGVRPLDPEVALETTVSCTEVTAASRETGRGHVKNITAF